MISGKCIVCETDKSGFPVIDDGVIKTIRAAKKRLKMAKGNTLIVCPACIDTYQKKRSDFEQSLVRYGLLGAFLLLLLVVVPLFIGGNFNLSTIVMAVLLALLIFAFSIFRYYPAADLTGYIAPAPEAVQQGAAQPPSAAPAASQAHPAPKNLLSMFPAKIPESPKGKVGGKKREKRK